MFKRTDSAELRYLVLQLLRDSEGNEQADTPDHLYDMWLPSQSQ